MYLEHMQCRGCLLYGLSVKGDSTVQAMHSWVLPPIHLYVVAVGGYQTNKELEWLISRNEPLLHSTEICTFYLPFPCLINLAHKILEGSDKVIHSLIGNFV